MVVQSRPMPKREKGPPAMTKTTLRLPIDLHKRLKVRAVQEGRHMEVLAAEALETYLDKAEKTSRGQK